MKHNDKLSQFPLSGINTYDKRYLLFLDVKHLRKSLKICVKQCPSRRLETLDQINQFYRETGSNLCRYDYDFNSPKSDSNKVNDLLGPCPTLPVYESIPVLHRCFPKPVKEIAQKVFSEFYEYLNSWETIEQILADLYSSWKELIIFSFVAFGKLLLLLILYNLNALF